jgi:DNA-binding transcriptional MocR family regulator
MKNKSGQSERQVVDALGVWANGNGPLHRQLTDALRGAIDRRDLAPGYRLPAERELAHALAVSRTTVVAALNQLRDEKLIVSKLGAGTWVTTQPRNLDARIPQSDVIATFPIQRLLRATKYPVENLLEMAAATFFEPLGVQDALREIDMSDLRGAGYLPYGHPTLRTALAEDLTARGVPTVPAQLLITTGIWQATDLLAALYLPNGEQAIVENPTWTGLLDVLRAKGARIRSAPVDDDGVRVPDIEEALQRSRASMVFVMPEYHNPTGAQLSLARRKELASVAERFELPIIEDLGLYGLGLGKPTPLPPIAAFCPDRWIVTVGSWAKVAWAGLRIGWIRASEPTISRLARLKAYADNGTPILSQLVAAQIIPRFEEIAAIRRSQIATKFAALTDALSRMLPSWTWKRPDGGLSLWVRLPVGSAFELSQVALRHSVEFSPGPVFCPDEGHQNYLRLPFVGLPEMIEESVDRLRSSWDMYTAQIS